MCIDTWLRITRRRKRLFSINQSRIQKHRSYRSSWGTLKTHMMSFFVWRTSLNHQSSYWRVTKTISTLILQCSLWIFSSTLGYKRSVLQWIKKRSGLPIVSNIEQITPSNIIDQSVTLQSGTRVLLAWALPSIFGRLYRNSGIVLGLVRPNH